MTRMGTNKFWILSEWILSKLFGVSVKIPRHFGCLSKRVFRKLLLFYISLMTPLCDCFFCVTIPPLVNAFTMRKSYFHIFVLRIRIRLRHFYLQYYIYMYICNIVFRLKTSFPYKSENFLLIVRIILSVFLRPCKVLSVRLNCKIMFCP